MTKTLSEFSSLEEILFGSIASTQGKSLTDGSAGIASEQKFPFWGSKNIARSNIPRI